jgi:hypothetical protein
VYGVIVECSVLVFRVLRRGFAPCSDVSDSSPSLSFQVWGIPCGLGGRNSLFSTTTTKWTTARLRSRVTTESVEVGAAVSSRWSPVARQLWRRRTSRPTSLFFTLSERNFNPARKRGTLATGDTPTATALESRVSRLLLVISGSGVWDISSRQTSSTLAYLAPSVVDLTHS